MRLKRLEISGFKTFRDKVDIDFSPGVSGIVGPNGCGKSNIVDALRWVMGEQRVKVIRGKKMDDVIFNGSENASPVGMTDVTITMVSNGQPFQGAYCECNEVSITRRLFREEESEYYINKVPCRLLDVKEFFMDSGVGTRTYSLIEQNSVATLVEAKPEERRQFIEEAAGIAKYKSRKEVAMRKMEATKQNMIRLHDIMKEVKTQLNAVSRQAKRAEEYKTLKNEIKEAELSIALTTYSELGGKRTELKKEKDILQSKIEEITQDLQARDAHFEEVKLALMENEEAISRLREELYSIKNELNVKEQRIEFSRRRIDDISSKKEHDMLEINEHERRLGEISGEMDGLICTVNQTEKEIIDLKNALIMNQQQLELLRQSERELNEELEEHKVSYIDIVAQKARLKNMESNIIKSFEDMKRQQGRYLREMEENDKRCTLVRQTIEELNWGLKEDKEKRELLKKDHDKLIQDLAHAKYRLQEIEACIASIKDDGSRKSTRLASLQEFQEGYAWCSDGIRYIMSGRRNGDLNDLSGDEFLGLVADHIDVPAEYETAVEAVLGERLQYVVVRSQEDGVKAIDYLKQSCKGRGSFVPLEVRNHYSNLELGEQLQGTMRLLDKVIVHDEFKEIMAYLLSDVLLISNLRSGLLLWKQNGFMGTFVTPEGDIINSQGVLTGGSINKGDKSLLAVKREIGNLKEEISRINCALNEALEDKNDLCHMIAQLEEKLQENKTDIHKHEIEINSKTKDLERFEEEIKRLDQRRDVLNFDNETIISEQKESLVKIETIKEEQIQLEDEERIRNQEIEALKGRNDILRKDLEKWEKEFTAAKVLLATREEKIASDRQVLFRLRTTREALEREIKEKQTEFENSTIHTQELAKNMGVQEKELTTLYDKYQLSETALAEKLNLQQEKENLLRNLDKEVKDIKQHLDQLGKEAGKLELSLRETAFHLESLKNSMSEKHYLDLDELSLKWPRLGEGELPDLVEKLEKARVKVDNFGEVNLLAINEYEALKERHDFLTAQAADIRVSLESLQRTIERINRISRARFAETFEAVNTCFKDMFARIFPGGSGRLYLTDDADMLETGVEIDIQTPGKRTRNISLLSGGEKSLAAIALILAIIQYRPTPFLILDEVDAALDDANISLFNKLIQDISKNSQIIMVTHNKKTMEAAENLYGITMQNQGISTIVTVGLN